MTAHPEETKTCRICGEEKPVTEFCQAEKNGVMVVQARCLDCRRAYYRGRAAGGYHRRYEQQRRDKVLRRLRSAANLAAARAVELGVLVPGPCACEDATCRGAVRAHHEDYSLPLEVTWLCRSHHQRRHAQLRRMARQHLAQLGLFAPDKAAQERRWVPKAGHFVRRRAG